MTKSKHSKLSVYISLILRHKPQVIGMKLDSKGYLNVDEMISNINKTGRSITRSILDEIVETDEKKRYSYNLDKTMIRANQGHSVNVDVGLKESIPPEYLYHGTGQQFAESILRTGILKQSRTHVHLSSDIKIAEQVGKRKGEAYIIVVPAAKMYEDGIKFYLSENGVWLVDKVDSKYL